jgi:hypothetical protein
VYEIDLEKVSSNSGIKDEKSPKKLKKRKNTEI